MAWGKRHKASGVGVAALTVALVGGAAGAAISGGNWNSAGGDAQNTRFQKSEHTLSASNVGDLEVSWKFETAGDVSATPAVDGSTVYVPDWGGYLYAINKDTGTLRWKVKISDLSGVAGDKARATPAIVGDRLVIGTQGSVLVPGGGSGAKVLALDKHTGALLWSTVADTHPAAIITQSATAFGNRVYVGVASMEEALAAIVPDYELTFRGSMLALDVATGDVVWQTYLAPQGYTGNAVWGSSPAIDAKRGQLYIATGNNYSVPDDVLACVAGAEGEDRAACLDAGDHFDSVLALDMRTGAVRWATRAIPYDAWNVDCIPFFGDGDQCPDPAGPDYDFGQAPALFTVKPSGKGKPVDVVGAGQKSGQYWALDPASGAVRWVTQAGPGGTAGGLQWGSAVDGTRVYTANANSGAIEWILPDGATTTLGMWSAIDAATGAVLWQHVPSDWEPGTGVGGTTSGPVTTANGVVYGCSLGASGTMYALDSSTGEELWSFASGGSCLSGAAISDGHLYWGSGYSNFGMGTPNNLLYAFGLPD